MFVCQECHTKRQARQALESQPLQWTGYNTWISRPTNCPDCSKHRKGTFYEYLNAFELSQELDALKEKWNAIQKQLDAMDFPLHMYSSAVDLAEQVKHSPAVLNDPEAMRQLIKYTAELEEIITCQN